MPRLRLCVGIGVMSWPSSRIAPAVGSSRPAIIRSSVVLPQPDGPSRQTKVPCGTSRLIASTAVKSPNRLVTSLIARPDMACLLNAFGQDCRAVGSAYRPRRSLPCSSPSVVGEERAVAAVPRPCEAAKVAQPEPAKAADGQGAESPAVSPDDQLGPLLVQPVRLRRIEVVARDDRLDLGGNGGEFLRRQVEHFASSASARCRPCATSGPGSPAGSYSR